jgi:hypothetical protein
MTGRYYSRFALLHRRALSAQSTSAHPVAVGVLRGLPVGGPLVGLLRCLGCAGAQEEARHNVPHIGLCMHTTGSQRYFLQNKEVVNNDAGDGCAAVPSTCNLANLPSQLALACTQLAMLET